MSAALTHFQRAAELLETTKNSLPEGSDLRAQVCGTLEQVLRVRNGVSSQVGDLRHSAVLGHEHTTLGRHAGRWSPY